MSEDRRFDTDRRRGSALFGAGVLALAAGCTAASGSPEWAGTMDTLPNGRVVVTNPATGRWTEGTAWRVVEELRIGAEDGDGPEVLGQIGLLAEDAGGRIWALETQDQQFKVFDREGRFVRTVGRRGGGPGELRQTAGAAPIAGGRMLVVDPQGARISIFDTAGAFLTGHPVSGGFSIFPWPGGVDREGFLYNVVPRAEPGRFLFVLVKYDSAMTPLDTLTPPAWAGPENFFEHRGPGGGVMRASVPHSPGLQWRLTRDGDFWFVHTGSYELFRRSARGDTVRSVIRPFTVVPVTGAEKDSAISRLSWFTGQGGSVDRGRIPDVKPAIQDFLVADDGYLWVIPTRADTLLNTPLGQRLFEIFDPEGRFLGEVRLPFALQSYPRPLILGDRIIGVTQNADGVPFIVRARIER